MIQKLREARARAANRMSALFARTDAGELDIAATQWTDEKQAEYDAAKQEVENIDAQIARAEEAIALIGDTSDKPLEDFLTQREPVGSGAVSLDEATAAAKRRSAAFDVWLRRGDAAMTADDWRALRQGDPVQTNVQTRGTDADGGYLVPEEFQANLLTKLNEIGAVRQIAAVERRPNGRKMIWPAADLSSSGAYIRAEGADATGAKATISQKSIEFDNWNSQIYEATYELLQDSAINVEGLLNEVLPHWIAQAQDVAMVAGSSVSGAKIVGLLESPGALGETTASGNTKAFTVDNLTNLVHSIRRPLRAGARFLFADSTEKYLKTLKDSQNRPLWLPGYVAGAPDIIMGFPYSIDDNVPAMAASAKSVLFGNFSHYKVFDATDVRLFRWGESDSTMAKKGVVGFMAEMRTAAGYVTAEAPVKWMAQAAS